MAKSASVSFWSKRSHWRPVAWGSILLCFWIRRCFISLAEEQTVCHDFWRLDPILNIVTPGGSIQDQQSCLRGAILIARVSVPLRENLASLTVLRSPAAVSSDDGACCRSNSSFCRFLNCRMASERACLRAAGFREPSMLMEAHSMAIVLGVMFLCLASNGTLYFYVKFEG